MSLKGITVVMKIEMDFQGIPLEKLGVIPPDLAGWAQELKKELELDFKGDPEMAARTKVSVKVEKH